MRRISQRVLQTILVKDTFCGLSVCDKIFQNSWRVQYLFGLLSIPHEITSTFNGSSYRVYYTTMWVDEYKQKDDGTLKTTLEDAPYKKLGFLKKVLQAVQEEGGYVYKHAARIHKKKNSI